MLQVAPMALELGLDSATSASLAELEVDLLRPRRDELTLELLESRRDDFAFVNGETLQVPSNKKVSLQRTVQNFLRN